MDPCPQDSRSSLRVGVVFGSEEEEERREVARRSVAGEPEVDAADGVSGCRDRATRQCGPSLLPMEA